MLELLDYCPNNIVTRSIFKKTTGEINIICVDKGKELKEKLSRFDQFIQILEGEADLQVETNSYLLKTGECFLIPANSKNKLSALCRFKMIL